MAKRSLSEQLDQAVEAILAHPDAALPQADARLAPLVRLAALLCNLPSEDFRVRLKADLIRRRSMTTKTGDVLREDLHTITPYLTAQKAPELIDFVKQAFGAAELRRGTGSAGGIHASVRIGDSILMIGGGGAWRGTPMPAAIHLYVPDADAVYQRALEAGATCLRAPVDQAYGDREASVKDLAGNHWYIATHQGGPPIPEGLRSVTPYLHPRGADQLIAFLRRAFGAEETACYRSPDGTILHAQITIGDSVVEMGEAHGDIQPMPAMFYLSVNDVDAWYGRAVQAGAASLAAPAEQPYGARVGSVTDPFGNVWYMATPLKKGKATTE
jgi:uncharacterized glyoxalase superfamily protein PhnB